MRRFVLALLLLAGVVVFAPLGAGASTGPTISSGSGGSGDEYGVRNCSQGLQICTEVKDSIGPNGAYTGHDEPSLLFYSDTQGSGNSNLYRLKLPSDPHFMPQQDGSGATWNFQLRPAFWFGMAMCDSQSFPEWTNTCAPDTDANIFDGTDETAADYIGKHPGAAYMEMQFYPPGWVPWPPGVSCDATKWCAATHDRQPQPERQHGVPNNADCLARVGIEPVKFAFITHNGVPHAPADPLSARAAVRRSRRTRRPTCS